MKPVSELHVLEEDEIGDLWCSTCRDADHPYGTRWADHPDYSDSSRPDA